MLFRRPGRRSKLLHRSSDIVKLSGTPHLKSGALTLVILSYLLGYQPTLAIPPIKRSEVKAEFAQEQQILPASFSSPLQLPHPGYLTTRYTNWHPGMDIATGLGMPVRPILEGRVRDVQYTFWGLGNFVTIEHEQQYQSTYGHMGRIYVKKGDSVSSSSILGEVGISGWSSGPHTHLEIERAGQTINPEMILPKVPSWEEYVQNHSTTSPSNATTGPALTP